MTPRHITLLISAAICLQFFHLGHAQEAGPRLRIDPINLQRHLREVYSGVRDDLHMNEKQRVRQAIVSYYQSILQALPFYVAPRWELRNHHYRTSDPLTGYTYDGTNIIMTMKGIRYNTSEDRISLIGAHYDSTALSPGVNDNGSGMAAMLEIARALAVAMSYNNCTFQNTVILAAFDHGDVGQYGSQDYVKYLDEQILQKTGVTNFTGAFILETMLNFDLNRLSQSFPPGFSLMFPAQYQEATNNDFRGDFLATFAREDDLLLTKLLAEQWSEITSYPLTSHYRYVNVPLVRTGSPEDWSSTDRLTMKDYLRSDHKSFWNRKNQYSQNGLRAVYITDTANYRSYMRACHNILCDDVVQGVTDDNIEFLQISAEAVFRSVVILATENRALICGTAAALPGLSSFLLLLTAFLVWFH